MAINATEKQKLAYDKANEVGGAGVTAVFTVESVAFNPLTSTVSVANTTNLATSGTATQVDTFSGAEASRAIDGNTSGVWSENSLSSTTNRATPWWQVDLGAIKSIDRIKVWNRTDAASDRLSNFDVFVSDNVFTSDDPTVTAQQAGVIRKHLSGECGTPTEFVVEGTGRYVRVQLLGTNYLTIAECQVFATSNAIATKIFAVGYDKAFASTVDGIELSDVQALVPAYLLTFTPKQDMRVSIGNIDYRIVQVSEHKIADTVIIYECQLRS